MHYEYLFTVFTATYNRAHTLHRVYDSLVSQTFRDFEWLLVDDGSTDSTRTLLSGWRRDADFPIRYLYQPNQGKHVAYNRAVPEARGSLFLTLDSDDSCVPHALETLKYYWETIPNERRSGFSAVNVLCRDERGRVVGRSFPNHVTDSDYLACQYQWKVRGERWEFQRTDVMREYPFPVPPVRLSHIPEGIVWSRIGREYKTRYVNEPLRHYFATDASLSRNRDHTQNAYPGMLYSRVVLNEHLDYFRYAPLDFIRSAANYVRWSLHVRGSALRKIGSLRSIAAKVMCLLLLPVALILYCADKESYARRTRARETR